ncbi:hypothetical protein MRX96_043734, partial [Rhipicephalus microplus]
MELPAAKQRRFQSLGLVGAVGGAVMGALSAQSLGRCRTMAVSVIGILCTWLCVGCAQEVWYLYTGRFINGFFAGMLSLVVPAQISELADPRNRGLQACSFGSIYVTLLGRYVTWSMLAFTCLLPAVILVPLSWFLVESPRWLLQIGQRERAMEMQRNLRKEPVEANAEFKLMEKAFSGTPTPSLHYWLSTHIMFTQQFCGANMAATCASVLMGPTGVYADREDTDLAILITQVAVALAALPLVDTVGRLRLLVVSANVCVASMISLGSMYPNMLIDAASETTTSTLSTAANASRTRCGRDHRSWEPAGTRLLDRLFLRICTGYWICHLDTVGHHQDVCPTPSTKVCDHCGHLPTDNPHVCNQPVCALCGEAHRTGDRECRHRYQLPYLVHRRRQRRRRRKQAQQQTPTPAPSPVSAETTEPQGPPLSPRNPTSTDQPTWADKAAELTPLRGHGVEFGSVCTFHWACAFCSVTFFERVRAGFSFGELAWFYGTLTLANGLVLYYFMPETKHLPLESILLDECPIETSAASRRFYPYRAHSEKTRPNEGSDSGTSAMAQPCKRPGQTPDPSHTPSKRSDQRAGECNCGDTNEPTTDDDASTIVGLDEKVDDWSDIGDDNFKM